VTDRADADRILDSTLYLVLGTADLDGRPWTSPVFFARVGDDRIYWVSSADARHSLNIAVRPGVSATVFDSTVPVGGAEAAYLDAEAAPALADETEAALAAMNARLPEGRGLTAADLQPHGPLTLYRADILHRYVLVRGGDPDHGNVLDMTVEV
jgi:nitroimidazol reductase NimA-like FMN-containing flavoprotein (pyridoxamine 5'-phosphate oxidase superfamily)